MSIMVKQLKSTSRDKFSVKPVTVLEVLIKLLFRLVLDVKVEV